MSSLRTAVALGLILLVGIGVVPSRQARADQLSAVDVQASANERRAVRGRSLPDLYEAPELSALRRFERGLTAVAVKEANEGPADPLAGLLLAEVDMRPTPELAALVGWFRGQPQQAPAGGADAAGKGPEVIAGLLARMARYRGEVEGALARAGVPRVLAYAALARSGFAPQASAPGGAVGLWLLPAPVASRLGLTVGYWVDERRDPVRASEAVGRWLALEQARLGSWAEALAAVAAELDRAAGENADRRAALFVARTFAAAVMGESREALGLPALPRPAAAPAVEQAEIPAGITLATVARAAGSTIEVLRGLNPSLLRDRTAPEQAMSLRLPGGTAAGCGAALAGLMGPADRVRTHRLRVGESLEDVGLRVGLGTRELRRLNGVRDAAELRGGTTVVLPASAAAMRVAAAEPTDARAVAATTEGAGELPVPGAAGALDPVGPLLAAVPDRTFALADRERAFYRTCEGDTLAELAAVFGVGEQDIVGWNNLDPAARLQARMVLQLYLPAGAGRADVALLAPAELRVVTLGSEEFHTLDAARRGKRRVAVTARAGDTLVKIARRFGLQPGDLARVNRLAWWAELPEGRPLVVYTSAAPPRELAVGRTLSPKRPAGREAHPAASTINRGLTLPPAKTAVPARPIKRGGKPAPVPAPARTMRR